VQRTAAGVSLLHLGERLEPIRGDPHAHAEGFETPSGHVPGVVHTDHSWRESNSGCHRLPGLPASLPPSRAARLTSATAADYGDGRRMGIPEAPTLAPSPPAAREAGLSLRTHVLIAALFLALVALYTPFAWALRGMQRLDGYNVAVMLTVFHNLLTQPRFLLEGPAFHPYGTTLTLMEPLLTPALVMGPLTALSGSPVVAFNLTLLFSWALSGWAMYVTTFWVTRRHAAALVAALVFTLCPARLGYHAFQVQLMFGFPFAVYGLVRFLETQRVRLLALLLAAFWLQAVAVVYYGVILGAGLTVLAVEYVLLRWRGWRLGTLVTGTLGAAVLGLALAPIAWPYLVTRRELGLERSLGDATSTGYSADLSAYLTTRGTWVWRLVRIEGLAEAPLFVGAGALGLVAVSLVMMLRRDPPGPAPRPGWVFAVGAGTALAVVAAAVAAGRPLEVGPVRSLFSAAGVGLLLCLMARHAVQGWDRWRRRQDDRRLTAREWVGVLWGVLVFAVLMSLGPIVHAGGRPLGDGLHQWLYPWVFPLRAIRLVTRFGMLAMFAAALLAGFAMAWLQDRLPGRACRLVAGLVPLVLLLEGAGVARVPLPPVTPRAVDAALHAEAGDGVVLEWPTNVPSIDADATFRSLVHGKRVVNGFAGFSLDLQRDLAARLSTPGPPFPTLEAQGALRRIYPLRYLVVRLGTLARPEQARWRALREAAPPLLRFRGTFGEEDLWELAPLPEEAVELERLIPYDTLRRRPVLELTLRPLVRDPRHDQWVEIGLNGHLVRRVPLDGEASVSVGLGRAFWHSQPNRLTLHYRYRRHAALGPRAIEDLVGQPPTGFAVTALALRPR
jgi:hypothetical protein